jgi:hypothetical protein
MKKTILTFAALTVIAATSFTSCSSPEQKVENAQNNVADANKDLDKANQEYAADIEAYRKQTDDSIAANKASIVEFNERIEKDKEADKAEYKKEINDLDQKNTDMKKKMDDYKAEGKDKWNTFKADFSRDMNDLGNSIKKLKNKLV